jgi:DNA repair protein RadA
MSSKDNGIIYVDTKNSFKAERIHQIAKSRGLDAEEIMKKINVCKIYYSAHLEAVIRSLAKYIEQYKARLVIIDSIISLHRAEFAGRETLAERQQRLNTSLHRSKPYRRDVIDAYDLGAYVIHDKTGTWQIWDMMR